MKGQLPLPIFDTVLTGRAKEHGVYLAGVADRAWEWRLHALQVVDELAATGQPFTADDLVARTGLPDTGANRNNAVGSLFNTLARKGVIVKTGDYRPSTRVDSHGHVIAVWVGNPDQDGP